MSKSWSLGLISCVMFALLSFGIAPAFGQPADRVLLKPGVPVVRKLTGGERHDYEIAADPDSYIDLTADQDGIDLVLVLMGPEGEILAEVDSPNGRNGPEELINIVRTGGLYTLRVWSPEEESVGGSYELKLLESRPSTSKDVAFVTATRLSRDANDLLAKIFSRVRMEKRQPSKEVDGMAQDEIIGKLKMAKELFAEAGRPEQHARTLSTLGLVHAIFDELGPAIEYWRESLELQFELKSPFAVNQVSNLGRAYRELGNFVEAVKVFQRGVEFFDRIGDPASKATCLYYLGNAFRDQGDAKTSLEFYLESLPLAEESGDPELLVTALHEIGSAYSKVGNYVKAMEYHRRALAMYESADQKGGIASIYVNISATYLAQNSLELALANGLKGLSTFEEIDAKGGIGTALLNIGAVYDAKKEYALSLSSYERALTVFEEIGWKERESYTLISIGRVLQHQGQLKLALESFLKGLKSFETLPDKLDVAESLNEVAQAYYALKDYPSALSFSERSAVISQEMDVPELLWRSLQNQGRALVALNRQDDAVRKFNESIGIIEDLRSNVVGGDDLDQQFFENKISPYADLVGVRVSQKRVAEAFTFAELMKSRTLLNVLRSGRIEISKGLSPKEREAESELKKELLALSLLHRAEMVKTQPDNAAIQNTVEARNKKRLELEDFRARMFAAHPELRVQRAEVEAIPLERAGQLLKDEKGLLLEFVFSDLQSYVFVIFRDRDAKLSSKVYEISGDSDQLRKQVLSLQSAIGNGDLGFRETSRSLYDALIRPVEKELAGKSNVIIVPDGPLWDLPFQALIDAKGKYLIEKAAISYAPSLTVLREMQKRAGERTAATEYELLAFGNPAIGKETAERVQRVFMSEKLEPLPEAERLVAGLGKLYGNERSRVFIGADALESVAKSEIPKYRTVQFATHGVLNNTSPMYSHLVMAQNAKDPVEDGLLEAWEFMEMDLNADLVILSACETARGRISGGEGVIGMSWALFLAGTPSVVASQWKVESSSTTELMLEFHKQLFSGGEISKAEALRRASLKLMRSKKYSHPSYWAGFIIIGDAN